jgi:hypothetical protein
MRLFRLEPCPRRLVVPVWAIVVVVLWAGLVAAEYLLRASTSDRDATVCIFRNLTGHPCPTCGSTRAVFALVGGHPLEAIAWNPLVMIGGFALMVMLLLPPAVGRRVRFDLSQRGWMWASIGLVVVVFLNWSYVWWRHSA